MLLRDALEKGDSATLTDFMVPAAERLEAAGLVLMAEAARMSQQGTLVGFLWDAGAITERKSIMQALHTFLDMRASK